MLARKDHFGNSRFLVELDGIVRAGFIEATFPDVYGKPTEYVGGNEAETIAKIPGLIKYSNVVLKRGITNSLYLYNWFTEIGYRKIKSARRTLSIILLDKEGNEAAKWDLVQAWPTKYTGPPANANQNEIAIETLEIAHQGITRVK